MAKLAGPLLLITGPSAVGKNTVVRKLSQDHKDFERVVTFTTRSPREGEKEGRDYYFITKRDFLRKLKAGSFIEHVEFNSHLYGTAPESFEAIWKKGKLPIMVIEVRGARKWQRRGGYAVFIAPQNFADLTALIESRGESRPKTLQRLQTAKRELKWADRFDTKIINRLGQLDTTIEKVAKIAAKLLNNSRRSQR